MALFTAALLEENRKSKVQTLLLNNKRVIDFFEDGDGYCIFHYQTIDNRRQKPVEFKFNGSMYSFMDLVNEAENATNRFVHCDVQKVNGVTVNTDYQIQVDHVVKGIDLTASTSRIFVAEGGFDMIEFDLPFTIASFNASSSTSGSMSTVL